MLSVCLSLPDSHVDCRLVVSHGVLCFLITALSSLCKEVWLASCHCLTRFKGHLQESRFREKPQVCLCEREREEGGRGVKRGRRGEGKREEERDFTYPLPL